MAISAQTRKVLWTRARDMCAFPGCRQALTVSQVDASTGQEFTTVVGEEAHIRSARPGGPRHIRSYPKDKLDSYENLILLCPTHHTLIDANNGEGHDVDTLVNMRRNHEEQQERKKQIEQTIRAYVAEQYTFDDKVLFDQVDLRGPSVDAMFVDVPFGCRPDTKVAQLMGRIAEMYPGDLEATKGAKGWVITGAAQALLHPEWTASALIVGGPGQGKSTLLQYVCQFYRARLLGRNAYTGEQQQLAWLTNVARVPIRLDLRKYAQWANARTNQFTAAKKQRKERDKAPRWPSIEQYIAAEVTHRSGGRTFSIKDLGLLVSVEPMLIALDGLDEVANLKHREQVSEEIVRTQARLDADAIDLVVLVATRPGSTTSALWSSQAFPNLYLHRLSQGLRLQYLQRWATVAKLSAPAADKLQKTFMDNQNVPHIRELASYPMQLAILLHLLYRRQLLPQQRTDLYREYLKTFLDREQTEDKEPLLSEQRQVIEDIHAFLGWYLQTKAEEGTSAGSIERAELKKLVRDHLAGREDGQRLAEQLFSAISTRVLCLVERDTGSFQFEVQSLREYFAALYIFENAPTKGTGNSRDDCLNELLQRPYWSNVCRFFVGMFSKVEVRGIRQNLRDLSVKLDLGLHPLLRSTAALLLDDRTYEGQADEPIQDVVDFILSGPGVVLAEDGLLDVSGSPLLLSERAGRAQAVRHLKDRLMTERSPVMRAALANVLRRHATVEDNLAGWWWKQFELTLQWLDTAARIGALGALNREHTAQLAKLLAGVSSDSVWLTDLLAQGGYNGIADEVLTICRDEINAGAGDALLAADRTTPMGHIIEVAAVAQLRATLSAAGKGTRTSSNAQTRFRRNTNDTLLTKVMETTDQLRKHPDPSATAQDWQTRLELIAKTWGDGWVLRQATAVLPPNTDLPGIAASLAPSQPVLATVLTLEAAARANSDNTDWWRSSLSTCESLLDQQNWIFSLLTVARPQVVVDIADELNKQVDQLPTKQFAVIIQAFKAIMRSPVARRLLLREPLRMQQVHFTPRVLWLIRVVATDATIEQIDKQLLNCFETLLQLGIGDMRDLPRIVGATKTIRAESLRGSRPVLPSGGWASDVKLGVIRPRLADDILRAPDQWPADIVQRAAEQIARRVADGTKPLAEVAKADRWFEES